MHVYGAIVSPAALGILFLFALYLALYHALFGWVLGRLHLGFGRESALWLSPFLWVAVELARARVTGFPWDLLGYTQVDNLALTRLAPWTGVMGLSLLVALVNMLWLVGAPGKNKLASRAGAGLAFLLILIFSALAVSYKPPQEMAGATALLLQENLKVGAEATGPPESRSQLLQSFSQLSLRPAIELSPGQKFGDASRKPEVVIWPEAPNEFVDDDPEFRAYLGSLAKRMGVPVVSDSITIAQRAGPERPLQLLNSASFFDAAGNHAGRYSKMHLVPFGEYTPYKQLFFFAGHLLDNVGPFLPGTTREMFVTNNHRYGVFICYESIFGDEMREYARSGADVLINISDDGWYGDSSAPWEHLDMVRMRAIENRRWVLRATNTGVTASVDPQGRIVAQMPRHIRSSMLAPFSYSSEQTFYTRHGDWLAWVCAAITAAVVLVSLTRRREVH